MPPINTTLDKEFISFYEELDIQSYQNHEIRIHVQEPKPATDKMAPMKMRYTTSKAKELETTITPLVQRLENISREKVHKTF